MKNVLIALFCVIISSLIFIQQINCEEEIYYSREYTVISANVGNSADVKGFVQPELWKLQPGSDEEKRVISGIQDIKPDILILIEAFNKQQVESMCFDFKNREQIYSVYGGPHDFICVKNEIGNVVNHEQMPGNSGVSVGYVDVEFKNEDGRNARIFYVHFLAPFPIWTPEKHKAHKDAFSWICNNLSDTPYLIGGDLNNDFIRWNYISSLYIKEGVNKLNPWIFNPSAEQFTDNLPNGSTGSDYEPTHRPELTFGWENTLDWVMGKQVVPPFKAPEFQPEIDPIGGGLNRFDFHFINSPPDWWQDTGAKDHSRFNFDHKPLYGKVVFWWKKAPSEITAPMPKILFLRQKEIQEEEELEEAEEVCYDLFAINPDGSGLTEILPKVLQKPTRLRTEPREIALSPNGEEIVVLYYEEPHGFPLPRIRIMGLNGEVKKSFPLFPEDNVWGINFIDDIRWSPDGKKIAFISNDDLYVMNPDGTDFRRLTADQEGYALNWWPDSQKILFLKLYENKGLYLINIDGNGPAQPVSFFSEVELPSEMPEFSPDGKMVAFKGLDDSELWIGEFIDDKISKTKRLTTGIGIVENIRWSRYGGKIAFTTDKNGLFVIDSDGKIKHLADGNIYLLSCSGSSAEKPFVIESPVKKGEKWKDYNIGAVSFSVPADWKVYISKQGDYFSTWSPQGRTDKKFIYFDVGSTEDPHYKGSETDEQKGGVTHYDRSGGKLEDAEGISPGITITHPKGKIVNSFKAEVAGRSVTVCELSYTEEGIEYTDWIFYLFKDEKHHLFTLTGVDPDYQDAIFKEFISRIRFSQGEN